MKLHNDNFDIQIQGNTSPSHQFSIAFNPKAFKVLSSTLYKDKVGSLVREISTNATDAHIAAGKQDVPFEVHLPDQFEPWFSVKDFGTGLTDDQIKNVFCSYFTSTKDQSNDMTGMLGLGSKSPFAYTDQFTVTSIVDGLKNVYSSFIDSNGYPNITLMHSEETAEGNGLEINVSVNPKDFTAFKTATAQQLKYFKVKPLVKNSDGFTFDSAPSKDSAKLSGEGYVLGDFMRGNESRIVVVQGQVGYPVDVQLLMESIPKESLTHEFLQKYLQLTFEMPLGTVGVTASREGIEYDKRTVANLKDRIEEILQEVKDNIDSELAKLPNDWERLKTRNALYNSISGGTDLSLPNVIFRYGQYEIGTGSSGYTLYLYSKYQRNGKIFIGALQPHTSTTILIVDAAKLNKAVIPEIEALGFKNIYFCIVGKDANIADVKKRLTDTFLGFSEFFVQSEFAVAKPARKSTAGQPRIPRTSYTTFNGTTIVKYWDKSTDKELPDEFVYVETERGALVNAPPDGNHIHSWKQLQRLAELEGLFLEEIDFDIPLLGIPKSSLSKVVGQGKALGDFIEDCLNKINKNYVRKYLIKKELYENACQISRSIRYDHIREAVTSSSDTLGEIMRKAEIVVNKKFVYNPDLANFAGMTLKSTFAGKLLDKFQKEKLKYPILGVDQHQLSHLHPDVLKKFMEVKVA